MVRKGLYSTAALEQAAKLLRDVANGMISAESALSVWPIELKRMKGDVLKAWTTLSHYSDDADILEKDESYSQAQKRAFLRLAERLQGAIEDAVQNY